MAPETFARLEVYFIAFIAASLLLAFWILPLLVTALTPYRYREVVVNERVAFATGEGLVQRAHEYWVLGRGAEEGGPRWSILRDVLGWGS